VIAQYMKSASQQSVIEVEQTHVLFFYFMRVPIELMKLNILFPFSGD
jgi:hypothetical protein